MSEDFYICLACAGVCVVMAVFGGVWALPFLIVGTFSFLVALLAFLLEG